MDTGGECADARAPRAAATARLGASARRAPCLPRLGRSDDHAARGSVARPRPLHPRSPHGARAARACARLVEHPRRVAGRGRARAAPRLSARAGAMRPRLVLVALVFALPLLHPVGATAAVHVPRGQVVHEIKVVGDDVRVDGRVDGSAIVIGGDLLVGSRGQVSDVTIIGGHLRTEEGARVTGDLYQLAGAWPDLGGWSLALALVLLLAARLLLVWLVVSAAELLAGGAHVA